MQGMIPGPVRAGVWLCFMHSSWFPNRVLQKGKGGADLYFFWLCLAKQSPEALWDVIYCINQMPIAETWLMCSGHNSWSMFAFLSI